MKKIELDSHLTAKAELWRVVSLFLQKWYIWESNNPKYKLVSIYIFLFLKKNFFLDRAFLFLII